ncbi:MAG: 16S rRNA (guanine(966)-N(2))-methyltransferase RsmD [Burkholderiaceae bacterium]|nr:16S rRNA (guanine(966)-N(2))-methyltransferase RsmD [Burkholderiaceae bacterium]
MGQLRIIGGKWKRTPIPVKDLQGLRPTPDRVRETLFNWLGQQLNGWRCLDLFAGSGALGLEAASRGADAVVLVESDRAASQAIGDLIKKLNAQSQCQLVQARAQEWLARPMSQPFDLIFLDPPFGYGLIDQVLPLLSRVLVAGGLVYVESDAPLGPAQADGCGLKLLRADKAGAVHYHLLQQCAAQGEQNAESGLSGDI